MTAPPDHDVLIIGGGPAGAATAAYLAQAGLDCRVLEKARFPRPHVGESLVPATTRVFRELGFLPTMEAAGFVHKYGAAWTAPGSHSMLEHDWEGVDPDCRVDIRFGERAQEGVDQNYTYHVDRARFDHLLLDHAAALGATVDQEAAVQRVDFSDPTRVTVRYRKAGAERHLSARVVVDASGRRTLLGEQLGLKVMDPAFDQYALHTWFENFDRGAGPTADYIVIHFLPQRGSWVWQIPVSGTVTSIGVVTQKAQFLQAKGTRETAFRRWAGSARDVADRLDAAVQLRPVQAEGDYSYAMRRFCGDRFVLVGDAARFVDPIFASGVSVALSSARYASRDILAAFERGRFSAPHFEPYERTLMRGCRTWYRFISLYYRLNVVFSLFIQDPRYRSDTLRLLQGDVYDEEEPAVLDEIEQFIAEVEANPRHLWHAALSPKGAPRTAGGQTA
ncbi:MAG: NAD(P)/FAD-dependent oxidoreductase [Rhodothermales bacterium]|nr:NAD(P)/FAD-dependent oxidoreductase [Rhodothermales bacterium]